MESESACDWSLVLQLNSSNTLAILSGYNISYFIAFIRYGITPHSPFLTTNQNEITKRLLNEPAGTGIS